jgi:hypothetical protein
LKVTGQKFDTFVVALDQALSSMDRVGAANGVSAAVGGPVVVNSDAVKPGNVAVLFYVDSNGNGRMDDSEANLVGLKLAVTDAKGATVGDYTSTDGGIAVDNLAPGQYTFTVTDTAGHTVSGADSVTVNVPQDAQQGEVVYFPAEQ